PRQELRAPAGERLLALVEPVDLGRLAGECALGLAEFDVAPHRHPVADVVGEQTEPFLVTPLVQKLGLAIQKFGDILHQQKLRYPLVAVSHPAAPRRPSPRAPLPPPGTPPGP